MPLAVPVLVDDEDRLPMPYVCWVIGDTLTSCFRFLRGPGPEIHRAAQHPRAQEQLRTLFYRTPRWQVKRGIDRRAKGDGMTALARAAAHGREQVVLSLLGAGASPAVPHEKSGWQALHGAAANGQHRCLVLLLAADADPNAPDASGRTPLHWAAFQANAGSEACVKTLLSAGAARDVNAADGKQLTPLHLAAVAGSLPSCKLLLRAGANVSARTGGGETPAQLAAAAGHGQVSRLLDKAAAGGAAGAEAGEAEAQPTAAAEEEAEAGQ